MIWNRFIAITLIFIAIILSLFIVYKVVLSQDINWRLDIMKDLCEKNNMSFNKGNVMFLEHAECYKSEGFIRIEYYAPQFFGDFDKVSNQYLVEV